MSSKNNPVFEKGQSDISLHNKSVAKMSLIEGTTSYRKIKVVVRKLIEKTRTRSM